MPLIILGLIVILGGCLLIYYQLGPKVTQRLGGKFGGWTSGGAAAETGVPVETKTEETGNRHFEGGDAGDEDPDQSAGGEAVKDGGEDSGEDACKDKVVFLFGNGKREERHIDEDDEHDGE